ncbi:MAG: hypothetical protein KAS32_10045 [Candidatus Peribacteraceae bacterium]|nr:hypothetical protein [Candidatus Peribacteraceae bacterium]
MTDKLKACNVYLVESTYPYEGSSISGVFSTAQKAQEFITEQTKLCNKFIADNEATDYQTKLKTPKCSCEDMEILEYCINDFDHYDHNFKNLTMEARDK